MEMKKEAEAGAEMEAVVEEEEVAEAAAAAAVLMDRGISSS